MTKKIITLALAMFAVTAFADNAAVLTKIKNANAQIKTIESSFKEVKKL